MASEKTSTTVIYAKQQSLTSEELLVYQLNYKTAMSGQFIINRFIVILIIYKVFH